MASVDLRKRNEKVYGVRTPKMLHSSSYSSFSNFKSSAVAQVRTKQKKKNERKILFCSMNKKIN